MLVETTGSLQLLVPIMLSVFAAKWAGDLLSRGIYDTVRPNPNPNPLAPRLTLPSLTGLTAVRGDARSTCKSGERRTWRNTTTRHSRATPSWRRRS